MTMQSTFVVLQSIHVDFYSNTIPTILYVDEPAMDDERSSQTTHVIESNVRKFDVPLWHRWHLLIRQKEPKSLVLVDHY